MRPGKSHLVIIVTAALTPNLHLAAQSTLFVDATARSGIDFRQVCGSKEKDWIVEVNGSGLALFDYDGDRDLDVYFVNGSVLKPSTVEPPRNALYRNDGDWRFTDVTATAGVGDEGWGSSAAVADFDNDGHLDLYITNWGPNVLYLNRGDGTFRRLESCGAEDPAWSASASCADFDGDGLVDIYVANYIDVSTLNPEKRRGTKECTYKGVPIFCGPGGWTPAADSVFRNEGGGKFRDVSEAWGVRKPPASFGLGTLVVDVQRDGFPDVIVANDTKRNYCFLGRKGGGFVEGGFYLGLAYNDYGVEQAGMGLASGDIRGAGRDDVFVTNFEDDTNTLYVMGEDRLYTEGTFPAGLGTASYPLLGWGTFFFDADGDGDLDLFVANGHVAPQVDRVRSSAGYDQRNQLFLNDGSGKFSELRDCPALTQRVCSSRGAACGDLDGDGDPDVVVSNIDGPPTVLENRSNASWLGVHLRGTHSNKAAIGARVTVTVGGRRQERTVQSGMSFASQCELAARFGLGTSRKASRVFVEWPRGRRETFAPPPGAGTMTVVEGTGDVP